MMKSEREIPSGKKKTSMIFSILVRLFLVSTIYHVGATANISLMNVNNEEVMMENLLIEFITDLKKFSLDKLNFHHLMLVGKNKGLLQTTRNILENTPYLIGTEAETIINPSHYGSKTIMLCFIDDFSSSEVNTILDELPHDFARRILLMSFKASTTNETVATTIASASKTKLRNLSFAYFDGNVMKIYKKQPVTCSSKISLINKWVPKKGFIKKQSVLSIFGYEKSRKFDNHGCPMTVSTLKLPPTMVLQEDENRSVKIRGGIEGHLVKTIAKYLNAVPVVKINSAGEVFWAAPNGTKFGIVADVAREDANFGIGRIRPTLARAKLVDFTASYDQECVIWTVPLKTEYNFNVLISEFSLTTWILVILSLFVLCGLGYAIPKLSRGTNHGHEKSLNICDVIAVFLAYAIPRRSLSRSMLGKLFFFLFLHHSRVLSTAYTASLASILTTAVQHPTVIDEEGIIASNLRTAGLRSGLEVLADQIPPNSSRIELINRFEVINSAEVALARIAKRRDIAYLRHSSSIFDIANNLRMEGKPVKFYPTHDCVISYHSIMVTPKGSLLTDPINSIILHLREAGIYKYWTNIERSFKSHYISPKRTGSNLSSLQSIFFLYLCCLIPAFLAFFAELIVFRLNIRYFRR